MRRMRKGLLLSVLSRWLVTSIFLVGCASNGPNNHLNQPQVIKMKPGPPRVGPWHCFQVDGNLQPWDERESCSRGIDRCKWMRDNALSVGLAATTCSRQPRAFCSKIVSRGLIFESCSITGEECERHFQASKKRTPKLDHRPCAEVASSSAPTSTNTHRRRWRR